MEINKEPQSITEINEFESQQQLSQEKPEILTTIEQKLELDEKKIENPLFEVKKWNAVALWSWDITVDICAICRNHIMDLCIECQATQSSNLNEECRIAWGACNHAYHEHCIRRWLKTRHVCPLDNRNWVLQRISKK